MLDRTTDEITQVSDTPVPMAPGDPDRSSFLPALSADGRVLAFLSGDPELVPGFEDTNDARDVVVAVLPEPGAALLGGTALGAVLALVAVRVNRR